MSIFMSLFFHAIQVFPANNFRCDKYCKKERAYLCFVIDRALELKVRPCVKEWNPLPLYCILSNLPFMSA